MLLGACACLAETRTKRPCSLAASWSWKARVVCWTVRTSRSWSRSQSASGASCSGCPAAPAADQVDQPVDPAEALDQRRAPAAHRLLVEQVDRAPVPALRRDPSSSPASRRASPGCDRSRRPSPPPRQAAPPPAARAHRRRRRWRSRDPARSSLTPPSSHPSAWPRDVRNFLSETFAKHRLRDVDKQIGSPHRRERAVNRRVQGDIGEFSAMEWLRSKGALVWIPLGHSPDVDLMAELDGGCSASK